MATAAETIIPVLAGAGFPFTYGAGRYTARTHGALLNLERMAKGSTVAEIYASADSRSEEIRILIRVAEALRAAGYAPSRDAFCVRVNWASCARKEAA